MTLALLSRPSTTSRKHRRRGSFSRIPDLDGLRAIALTLVVLYHLFGHGRVSGGVDVFLFVSGLVLALSLHAAAARGKTSAVLSRWGRTFGRLAPPAATVLIAVIVLAFTVLAPWEREQTLIEVISAALYFENWQLIWSQLAYGAAGPEASPVQHFWSLSVQGQVIIVVPLVVGVIFALRRTIRKPGQVAWGLLALATLASFIYATAAQPADPARIYFDTFARFWEFGVGALLAGVLRAGAALPPFAALPLGWLGLAAVLFSGFIVDGASAYPGPAALVPVGGAALVVLSVRSPTPFTVSNMLRARAFVAFSKISYSLYLWHWPVLIAYLTIDSASSDGVNALGAIVVLGISLVLAVLTWFLVERPVNAVIRADSRSRRSGLISLLSIGLVAAIGSALLVNAVGRGADESIATATSGDGAVVVEDCRGAAVLDPLRGECDASDFVGTEPLPEPALLARDDANRPACWATASESTLDICELGPTDAAVRLLAVGDSHNNTLVGAYEMIASSRGWRIDVAGREGCDWSHAYRDQATDQRVQQCLDWVNLVDEHVAATAYDAIVVMHSSRAAYRAAPDSEKLPDDDPVVEELRRDGLVQAWATRPDPSVPIIAIRDNPIFPSGQLDCVLDERSIANGECDFPREDVLLDDGNAAAVAEDPNAHLIDLTEYMCEESTCSMVVGGVIVTRDGFHLSATYARSLAPYLDRALAAMVEPISST